MALRMFLFAAFATTLMGLLLWYMGNRTGSILPVRFRKPMWVVLVLYGVGTIGVFATLRRESHPDWMTSIHWSVYLAMGLVSVVLAGLIAVDFGQIVLKALDWIRFKWGAEDALLEQVDPQRRQLLGGVLTAGVWTMAGSVTVLGSREAKRLAEVKEVEIPIEGLHSSLDGLRIVQLTDIHVGPTIKRAYVQGIVERVNELNADLVVITGDIVDGKVVALRDDVAPLGQLTSRHGTWVVTGNHEYYSGVEEWVEEFRRIGIRVLLNEHDLVQHDDTAFVVAGITDFRAERMKPEHKSDPASAIAGAPDNLFRLLLAHQPRSAKGAHQAAHFDLQLSGHTHGGQYFPWNLIVPFVQPYAVGLHQLGKMWIYTSRGTAYWGPPIRLGAPAEITLVRLAIAEA